MQMMTMCFWEIRKSQLVKAILPAFLPKIVLNAFNSTEMIVGDTFAFVVDINY